jgi:copper transport protein
VALALLAVPTPAAAHAELIGSEPEANTSLPEGPDALVLDFSEAVDPATVMVRLIDARQAEIALADDFAFEDGDERVRVPLPELDPGTYTVEYRVVSAVDGHTTGGIFAFLVDPTGIEPAPTLPAETLTTSDDMVTITARWVALAAGLVLLGIPSFWLLSAAPALRRSSRPELGGVGIWPMIGAAAFLAFAGTASYLALAAGSFAGGEAGADHASHGLVGFPFDFAAPFGWTPFAIAMRVSLLGALVAFLVAAAMYVVSDEQRRAAGHMSSYGGIAFAASDWLHLVGVALWLGALPALLLLGLAARRAAVGGVLSAAVRRHGRVALVAAPLVALTGIANSPLVLGENRELVASGYGNLVVAKVLLFSVAVGIGAVNFMLGRAARGRVSLSVVGAELVVAAAAVMAAAAMVTVQPAAARGPVLSASAVSTAHLYGTAGDSSVHSAINLPAPGKNTYHGTDVSDSIS